MKSAVKTKPQTETTFQQFCALLEKVSHMWSNDFFLKACKLPEGEIKKWYAGEKFPTASKLDSILRFIAHYEGAANAPKGYIKAYATLRRLLEAPLEEEMQKKWHASTIGDYIVQSKLQEVQAITRYSPFEVKMELTLLYQRLLINTASITQHPREVRLALKKRLGNAVAHLPLLTEEEVQENHKVVVRMIASVYEEMGTDLINIGIDLIDQAHHIARQRGHTKIEIIHLALAFFSNTKEIDLLRKCIDKRHKDSLTTLRDKVRTLLPAEEPINAKDIDFGIHVYPVFSQASQLAGLLTDDYVSPEVLLIAILKSDSPVSKCLQEAGITIKKLVKLLPVKD